MKVLAVIPARGGSKGIPRKNIVNFCGKPLIDYTFEAAKQARGISKIIVSTEDQEIKSFSESKNIEVIMRPRYLAQDNTTTKDVLNHVILEGDFQNKYDLVLTLQPTSPLRKVFHIEESIKLMIENTNADSLVSCMKVPHNFNPQSLMMLNKNGYLYEADINKKNYRRQDKQVFYARNGAAIYITKINRIKEYIFGGNIIPYFMDLHYSIDIDEFSDLYLAELIYKSKFNNV